MAEDPSLSLTARRVAAYRLGFERLPAPFGDPTADEALSRDVAGDTPTGSSEWMARYLRARTAFFDRVVVNAIGRGVTQLVSIGAGYDGRALRYAKPGVRWWEVDQPATQADKRSRLDRLGIPVHDVGFVTHDLTEPGLADRLLEAGYEPDATGLLISEGVAVYLDTSSLEMLLAEARSLATVGTRLAVSLGGSRNGEGRAIRRERFEAAVAAMGEPARNALTTELATPLLEAARWRTVDISERAQKAGFVVAAPIWAPSRAGCRDTFSRVGRFNERMLHRDGTDALEEHLVGTYGIPVTTLDRLDVGVYRVGRADGSRWVARVFPATRSIEAVEHEADLLESLTAQGFPAERVAHPRPVSSHRGQPVLVTEFFAGRRPAATPATYSTLGRLLARLHTFEAAPALRSPGGAWHHLALDCGLTGEKEAALDVFGAARLRVPPDSRAAFDQLATDLEAVDDLVGLPSALGHPDPVPSNLIAGRQGSILVDWTGAGWAPRLASLGCLLWAASARGQSSVDAVITAYRPSVELEREEIDRLEQAMSIRPLLLACWNFATGRSGIEEQSAWWRKQNQRIVEAAGRARALLRRG